MESIKFEQDKNKKTKKITLSKAITTLIIIILLITKKKYYPR